jgi:prevent-host-death family protein
VKTHLSALVDEVVRTHEQVTITRNGQPVAVVLSLEDYESLLETLALLDDQTGRERLEEAEAAVVEELPAAIAFAVWEFIDGPLRDNPQRVGHRLRPPFAGSWSARRGTSRHLSCPLPDR